MKYEFKDLLVHKKTKYLIELLLCLKDGKPIAAIHETKDRVKGKQITDAAYMIAFPKLTGNFLLDVKVVLKHFKTHGYKLVNTISNTSKGIKFG